ncbi:mannitol dehydrogenase family protein [Trinickia caryophylli]|uniref:Tagaturonate reductase n=1 Tax=Trinickia caryophylli TaxID=28094 RepID=A0A1X7DP25_TRICW|nr:D-mannonate oxidoreductase [Trinickia caryophylli]PMS10617.1 D-mannonate oxidoreductase [Trinickia caryophylli]TRX17206.1 mannitol dehydrogenase family protein [Trinickia caryophylli]WQE12060.1 mannitol dehydrogenase family protein [Trinickia caryophylli]SMF18773.1 tagaturonate reductase [Trinickia caryophylli]GLU31817.1 D-mannonate oxidoreductase [Trinickia caryophylli]
MGNPILQFGTSRFLQAHADLFIAEALEAGRALGQVTVVQTTSNPESRARIEALRTRGSYPVRIRGLRREAVVDTTVESRAVSEALDANADWPLVVERFVHDARVVISNTSDSGYACFPEDTAQLLAPGAGVPRGFAAKLVVLLRARYAANAAPLTLLPCELVSNNGDTLRALVAGLAHEWTGDEAFERYVEHTCVWVNSLVDRIVSEPIRPVGAVAEPYALWAIERRPGMVLPCEHDAMIVTDDLAHYERLKLLLLNLGHTFLAERWLTDGRPADENTLQAMRDPALRGELEGLWQEEVLPVFDALGQGETARRYLADVRERFENPFLDHKLADIARNHQEKKLRRLRPVVELAASLGLKLAQPRLNEALRTNALA